MESLFKSFTTLEEWQVSASEAVPSRTPRENNPATLFQDSPILGCAQSSFPYKIPSIGKCRPLQHNHPGILKEESPRARAIQSGSQRAQASRPRALLLFPIFLPIIPCALGAISFLSQSHPRLFTIASFFGPSLLLPRELIRPLCIKMSSIKFIYYPIIIDCVPALYKYSIYLDLPLFLFTLASNKQSLFP